MHALAQKLQHSAVSNYFYFMFAVKMPREVGPEKRHFGGEDGLITETTGGRTRHFWRCAFCNWEMGGKNFQNNKARIHLSGLVSIVCNAAPDNIKEKFSALERLKRVAKAQNKAKRQRADELLGKNKKGKPSPSRQSKLGYRNKATAEEVDLAWGEAFFGCDIPVAKIDHPLFRQAIAMTKRSRTGYT